MSPRRSRVASLAGAAALALGLLAAPTAQAASDHVLISEVYGGGGNSGATWTNDFVELYNPTAAAVSLAGYTVSYFSAGGSPGASCTLAGSIAAGGYFLVQEAAGSGGTQPLPTPDAVCTSAMSATSGSIKLADASGALVDLVGYGSAAVKETASAPTLSNTTSASRATWTDTNDNSVDFVAGTPTPRNSGSSEPPPPPPNPTIADIQGPGAVSPLVGQKVTTTGVVTAVYPTGGFNGVYLQTPGTGGVAKPAGTPSDGLFLFSSAAANTLAVGDCVTVAATTVSEFNGLTELSGGTATRITGCAPVVPTELTTLPATDAAKEAYEGMLVLPRGTYTITNNYQLNQYGQLGFAVGTEPLYAATDVVPWPDAPAYEAGNLAKYITVDDGSSWDYLNNATAKASPLPYLSQDEPMRTGSHVSFAKPVILDYRFQWNFQPVGQVVGATDADDPLVSQNDRETTAPSVGGDVRIASFNVLNYFTDLGQAEAGCAFYADRAGHPVATNNCEVRGAWTQSAFEDQQTKIVAAINALHADVVGLEEIENSAGISYLPGQTRDKSVATLVAALNAAGGTWAYVPSPTVVPSSEDVIRTAFVYNPTRVAPLGRSSIDLADAFANARYPLAQKFKALKAGKPFVLVTNHFKSKGSGADDGTGQGLSNPSREAQASQLTGWVDELFPDEAVLLIGDFNSYAKETPVQLIEGAGYTNLAKTFDPGSTSYQFSGRLGSLDHAFANARALQLVVGASVWDINADESVALQYSRRNDNLVDFFAATPYAASDHDPVVVGLDVTGRRSH